MIHSAGLMRGMSGVPENDYRLLNTDATIGLARSAQRADVKRFAFLSSIRAQCGPASQTVLTEADDPKPTDAYRKSKLAAELGLMGLDLDWVSLRAGLVYGPGVKGNMARSIWLARSPFPLPLYSGRRLLLAVENLLAAIETVLRTPGRLQRAFIVADMEALTVAEMIAALRQGLGRQPAVSPLSPALLEVQLRAIGQEELHLWLSASLVPNPSALPALGWTPQLATAVGLGRLMRTSGA